jgi:hypothetical protein
MKLLTLRNVWGSDHNGTELGRFPTPARLAGWPVASAVLRGGLVKAKEAARQQPSKLLPEALGAWIV